MIFKLVVNEAKIDDAQFTIDEELIAQPTTLSSPGCDCKRIDRLHFGCPIN